MRFLDFRDYKKRKKYRDKSNKRKKCEKKTRKFLIWEDQILSLSLINRKKLIKSMKRARKFYVNFKVNFYKFSSIFPSLSILNFQVSIYNLIRNSAGNFLLFQNICLLGKIRKFSKKFRILLRFLLNLLNCFWFDFH